MKNSFTPGNSNTSGSGGNNIIKSTVDMQAALDQMNNDFESNRKKTKKILDEGQKEEDNEGTTEEIKEKVDIEEKIVEKNTKEIKKNDAFGKFIKHQDSKIEKDFNSKIGQALVDGGHITPGQLKQALLFQEVAKDPDSFFDNPDNFLKQKSSKPKDDNLHIKSTQKKSDKKIPRIGELCLENGWITSHVLNKVLLESGKPLMLGERLHHAGLLTLEQIDDILEKQKIYKEAGEEKQFGDIALELKYIKEFELLQKISQHIDTKFFDISIDDYKIFNNDIILEYPKLKNIFDEKFCSEYEIIPVLYIPTEETNNKNTDKKEKDHLTIVAANIEKTEEMIEELSKKYNINIEVFLGNKKHIEKGITKLFNRDPYSSSGETNEDKLSATNTLNKIIMNAFLKGASDIHIEPKKEHIIVRTRILGELQISQKLHKDVLKSLVNVVKTEFNGKIEETRAPQDGNINKIIGGHICKIRASTLPTVYGEKITMRLIDESAPTPTIEDLGTAPRLEKILKNASEKKAGIIVVTGETGSGKSTSIAGMIINIAGEELNISTIEDPVERGLGPHVNQSQTSNKLSFAQAIRTFMRQDPDVIMVGEIRDEETALASFSAALSGHLVYTTLHTGEAIKTKNRLNNQGIPNYLVAENLVISTNQQLVKKLCKCAKPLEKLPSDKFFKKLEFPEHIINEIKNDFKAPAEEKIYNFKEPNGCPNCNGTGYIGRQVVMEILTNTSGIEDLIFKNASEQEIRDFARKHQQMNMLPEEAIRLVAYGKTTFKDITNINRGKYNLKSLKQIIIDATTTPVPNFNESLNKIKEEQKTNNSNKKNTQTTDNTELLLKGSTSNTDYSNNEEIKETNKSLLFIESVPEDSKLGTEIKEIKKQIGYIINLYKKEDKKSLTKATLAVQSTITQIQEIIKNNNDSKFIPFIESTKITLEQIIS